jgi:hypothetical protein
VIRGRPAFRCEHRWFGSSSRCRSVWSVRTLSTRRGICVIPRRGPYWLVTVSSFQGSGTAGGYVTGNPLHCQQPFQGIREPVLPSLANTNAPGLSEGAAGDVMHHVCDTDSSIGSPPRGRSLSRLRSTRFTLRPRQGARIRIAPAQGARNREFTIPERFLERRAPNGDIAAQEPCAAATTRAYRRLPTCTTTPSIRARASS